MRGGERGAAATVTPTRKRGANRTEGRRGAPALSLGLTWDTRHRARRGTAAAYSRATAAVSPSLLGARLSTPAATRKRPRAVCRDYFSPKRAMPTSSAFRKTWSTSSSRQAKSSPVTTPTAVSATAPAVRAKAKEVPSPTDTAPPSYATLMAEAPAPATRTASSSTSSLPKQTRPARNQRFTQYGTRFNATNETAGPGGVPTVARSPEDPSVRFVSIGGGGPTSASTDRATSIGRGRDNNLGRGNDNAASENETEGRARGGARYAPRERERETNGASPLQPLTGPAALASLIDRTLTVTTGRTAGDTLSTLDPSITSGGSGGRGFEVRSGGGSGGGGVDCISPVFSETWEWERPETPPAPMLNLHQSSGSEGPSGSEDDEGFGVGHQAGSAEYEDFVSQRRRSAGNNAQGFAAVDAANNASSSSSAFRFRPALLSVPRGFAPGISGKGAAEALRSAMARGTVEGSSLSPPPEHASLPPRIPRSASVGAMVASLIVPTPAPPQPSARKLAGGGAPVPAAVGVPAGVALSRSRSPARVRSSAKPARARGLRGGTDNSFHGHGGRYYFRDPRLEATLVREGQR